MKQPFYTIQQAAEILRYNPKSLGVRVRRGEVPYIQINGRGKRLIPASWINGLLAGAAEKEGNNGK